MSASSPQVLVVGGGPGGAAAAYWLARRGFEVVVVEKKTYPRDKTCGDGLTPRAIRQLLDMGFDFDRSDTHRIIGLRAFAGDLTIELPWPQHTVFPDWGATLRRADLDMEVVALAEKQGAVVRQGTEAVPIVEDGALVAVELRQKGAASEVVHPGYVVIADG
jgi:flavin-dependent dehydrogenase